MLYNSISLVKEKFRSMLPTQVIVLKDKYNVIYGGGRKGKTQGKTQKIDGFKFSKLFSLSKCVFVWCLGPGSGVSLIKKLEVML